MKARVLLLLVEAGVAAAVGYAVSALGTSPTPPQVPRFAFSESTAPASFPSSYPDFLASPVFTGCQWPDGRTSITATEAEAEGCALLPGGRSFALLESPIGGAKFPRQDGQLSDDIRFVHRSRTPGTIDVGPILMQFGAYSGGAQPSLVCNAGSCWLFDFVTENGPEVLRISTTTGAILQRTAMPAISRPYIGVDKYGFWMGQAGSSFYADDKVVLGIWLAPIGATRGVLLRRSEDVVLGMHQSGDAMVVDVRPRLPSPAATYARRFSPTARRAA